MFQLIFVDDESIIRDGIKKCINWEENGFELGGIFENGEKALEFVEQKHVDVVISDINMPRMDGLALSKILAERYPSIILILLTGYDQFDYAQQAIEFKVTEFILKPVTADELAKVLKKVRYELILRDEKEKEQVLLQEKLRESFPLLRERFFYRFVSGRLDKATVERRKNFFQWDDLSDNYQIMAVILPEDCGDIESFTVLEQIKKLRNDADEFFMDRNNILIGLIQEHTEEIIEGKVKTLAEQIFHRTAELSLEPVYIGYGNPVNDCCLIDTSYRGALTAARYGKLMEVSQIISVRDIQNREKPSIVQFISLENTFFRQLEEGSREQAKAALKDIFVFLKENVLTGEEAAYFFIRIHGVMHAFLKEMDLFSSITRFSSLPPSEFETLTAAEKYFIRQIDLVEDQILISRNDIVRRRIDKAKKIIADNYNNKKFSLQDMCNELYLSTSQFSVIFKEGTGMTFIEYLTSFRIDKAKKLLKTTDKRSYEIADAVGYGDPRYFSIIFKKYTGITPLEYRKEGEE